MFCRHSYEVVGVEYIRLRSELSEYDATRMLRRCTKCGKPNSKNIEGNWTLEMLQGTSDTPLYVVKEKKE